MEVAMNNVRLRRIRFSSLLVILSGLAMLSITPDPAVSHHGIPGVCSYFCEDYCPISPSDYCDEHNCGPYGVCESGTEWNGCGQNATGFTANSSEPPDPDGMRAAAHIGCSFASITTGLVKGNSASSGHPRELDDGGQ
jgi:hypothetical protein